jgi:hypothetical protein
MLPNDPILLKNLGDAHLAELRANAASQRRADSWRLPAWRSIAGRAMLRAGLRLLGEPRGLDMVDGSQTADHV